MNNFRMTLGVMALFVFIMTTGEIHADYSNYPVTVYAGHECGPDISGDIVVWTGSRGSSTTCDIWGKNLTTGEEFLIFQPTTSAQTSVGIYGNTVVYSDYRGSDYHIYGMDLTSRNEFLISSVNAVQPINPKINGNLVTWQDWRDGNWNIYAKNLSTSIEFPATNHAGHECGPVISGDIVVWTGSQGSSTTCDIWGKSLTTGEEFLIFQPTTSAQTSVGIYGNTVVYSDYRGSDYHIYGMDLTSRNEFLISSVSAVQPINPKINGNLVVWQDWRDGNWNIYGATIPEPCTFLLLGLGGLALRYRKS